jgi:hypothetical protein
MTKAADDPAGNPAGSVASRRGRGDASDRLPPHGKGRGFAEDGNALAPEPADPPTNAPDGGNGAALPAAVANAPDAVAAVPEAPGGTAGATTPTVIFDFSHSPLGVSGPAYLLPTQNEGSSILAIVNGQFLTDAFQGKLFLYVPNFIPAMSDLYIYYGIEGETGETYLLRLNTATPAYDYTTTAFGVWYGSVLSQTYTSIDVFAVHQGSGTANSTGGVSTPMVLDGQVGTITLPSAVTIASGPNPSTTAALYIGSPQADTIDVSINALNATIIGTPGDDSLTGFGLGTTVFDYETNGFTGFAAGTKQTITFGNEFLPGVLSLDMTLKLPGSAGDYSFAGIVPDDQVNHISLTIKTKFTTPIELDTTAIQHLRFGDLATNLVALTANTVAVEMLQLATEVYGNKTPLQHKIEPLAYQSGYYAGVAAAAASRNWHPVEAAELDLLPADYNAVGTIRYSLVDGFYAAYDTGDSLLHDSSEADALVLTGVVEGKRTLAIVFRGTDQYADFADFLNFGTYYAKYAPLIAALKTYVGNVQNGIQQILVGGHSLGAGAVQYFMSQFPDTAAYSVRAFTDGSPGSDTGVATDSRIDNFVHPEDPVAGLVIPVTSLPGKLAISSLITAVTAASFGLPPLLGVPAITLGTTLNVILWSASQRLRLGTDIIIDDQFMQTYTLAAHSSVLYEADLAQIAGFADDTASPFYGSALAAALRAGTMYTGNTVRLGLTHGGVLTIDARDNYDLGSDGDDKFVIPQSQLGSTMHVIDGGTGINRLVLPGLPEAAWSWKTDGSGGYLLSVSSSLFGGNQLIADVYRVSYMVFPSDTSGNYLMTFDGSTPIVQTPPRSQSTGGGSDPGGNDPGGGATTFVIDPSFAYADLGDVNLSVTGSGKGDTIAIGAGSDSITEPGGNNVIFVKKPATAGNLTISTGPGNNYVSLGAGTNVVTGGTGDDTFVLNGGNSTLTGGGGNDTFNIVSGAVHVTDFSGDDVIEIDNPKASILGESVHGGQTVLTLDTTGSGQPGATVTLDGVNGRISGSVANGTTLFRLSPNTGQVTGTAKGDFSGSGQSALAWQNADGQPVVWLVDGTIATASALAGSNPGPAWHIVGTGSFDGSGRAGLLWQNTDGAAAIWLMNGTTATTTTLVAPNPGPAWRLVGTGDLNGDGQSDLLWQNYDGAAAIWLMNGTSPSATAILGPSPGADWHLLGAGDFNGDGDGDLLWQNDDGRAAIWLMNGTSVTTKALAGGNPGPRWHVIGSGDFNGDGRGDILWQNDDGAVAVWLMNGTTPTSQAAAGNPGAGWRAVGIGDFNGDGQSDILFQNFDGQAAIWLMNGTTALAQALVGASPGASWHLQTAPGVRDSRQVPANFSGFGDSDLMWQNTDGQAVIWLMDGTSVLATAFAGANPGPSWRLVSSGYFDGSGRSGLLWQNADGRAAIWLMNGAQPAATTLVGGNPGPAWHLIASADTNGDGQSDLLWQNSDGQAAVWLMNGTTPSATAFLGANPGPSWHLVGAADFNGDGRSDIFWQNSDGRAAVWLVSGTSVTGTALVTPNPGPSWHLIGAGDVNGDGKADLLWQSTDGQAAVWLMNGASATTQAAIGANPGPAWHLIGTGDVNGDGRADLLWQNSDGRAEVWLTNGTSPLATTPVGASPGPAWHLLAG